MLRCGKYEFSLTKPLVMGIVNLTPDSFSGDGHSGDARRAIEHARLQMEAGADILDLGAESSRPGAIPTPLELELQRLVPVLQELARWDVPVSIDTYKPEVMTAALSLGAAMINDISALAHPAAPGIAAQSDCAICLMHMRGQPLTMQNDPSYGDVVEEVQGFLAARIEAAISAGISRDRLVVDPGFGFGKLLQHNADLFRALPRLAADGLPLLVGVSRKSMIGSITGREVDQRVVGSAVAAVLAAQFGARILRVHDVAATKDALAIYSALT